MSDLSMYELEDIVWDDFNQGDDHIVPHPTNARASRSSFEGDSCKKPRGETSPVFHNTGNLDASNTIRQEKSERDSKQIDKKKKMMEKESPSHAPPTNLASDETRMSNNCHRSSYVTSGDEFNVGDRVLSGTSAAGDNTSYSYPRTHISQTENLRFVDNNCEDKESDETRMSNNCHRSSYVTSGDEFNVGDRVLSGTSAAGDNTSYSYPRTHISQTENLRFVDNNCEDKESGDLLYYSWPDIGNFDVVDKMLRSCDSSFGLGVTDNDDELGWFTADQTKGTEEAMKMDFKFSCPEPGSLKHLLQDHDSPESNSQRFSYISENKKELNYKDQKKQSRHQNQTDGKKAGKSVGNDGSFYQISDLTSNNSRLSSNDSFDQVFTSIGNGHQYRNLEVDYFGQTQSNISYLPPHYPHQTTSGQFLSGIKSEHKGLMSPSLMGSSYASNQGHSMESSGNHLFDETAAELDERQQAYDSQGFQPFIMGNSRQVGRMFQSSRGGLVSAEKQKELESQSDMEGVQKGSEIGSLKAPESSSVSSVLDEISLEATSYRQLQQVMVQLDLRTKLCIRDSLYRLARSAEQRHHNPSLSSIATNDDLGGPLQAERTDKCTVFMDMETDTNPIDRSVAHLLFQRPSESPNLPAPLLPNPNLDHGSIPGPSDDGRET